MIHPASVLLVTGASRGIGAATARLAAQRGWDVAVNYHRDQGAAEQVADAVRAAGRRAITVAADVADEPAVLAMFGRIDDELGRLTGLVNNAGIVAMKPGWRRWTWRAGSACGRSISPAACCVRARRCAA